MQKIVRSVIGIGIYAVAFVRATQYFELKQYLVMDTTVLSLIGEEIEDPFGLNCNDLPTGDIAHAIKKNVF